ncbi:tetratricopeptide repeat protein [Rhodothermus profundi]|uniref:Tetratricopeptide repeat-containing protein n=1 Tax=Rhodothermus profundi TaxID=633813 RepID=A0A1M6R6H1_9BACT|nr:hypothetical protein [Rhodothermus profundi]SHK28043.1 hypothetical protein SAMN04488087_0724 [Rhodothermus profundi]
MNQTLGDKILRFPWLSAEEQQQVLEEARRAPEWRELLDAVQSIAPLLQSVRVTPEDPMSKELLAFYLITRRLSPHPLPSALATFFAQLEAQLEADAALRQRCEEVAQQVEALARTFDARVHFEQLTGRTLSEEASVEAVEEATGARVLRPPASRCTGAGDRSARPLRRQTIWRWVERGAFVVVVLSVIYGGLFWWSRVSRSELEQLGFIAPAHLAVEHYRGEALSAQTETYQEALQQIRAAYSSFLGLFPRYDAARLARAESLLVAVVEAEPPSSPLRQEAHFLLAKVRMLQHNVEGAREVLQKIAAAEGPYTEEAQRLLTRLQCLETPARC